MVKVYIVHPNHDYAVEEVFTTRELAEEHCQNLIDPKYPNLGHYVEEREILDYVPEGGNRYERFLIGEEDFS